MDIKYNVGSDVDSSIDIKDEPLNIPLEDEMGAPALVGIKEEPVDSLDVPLEVKEDPVDSLVVDRLDVPLEVKEDPVDSLVVDRLDVPIEIKEDPMDSRVVDRLDVPLEVKDHPVDSLVVDRLDVPLEVKDHPLDSLVVDGLDVPLEVKEESVDTAFTVMNSDDLVKNEYPMEAVFVIVEATDLSTETGMDNDREVMMVEQKYFYSKDPLSDVRDVFKFETVTSTDFSTSIIEVADPPTETDNDWDVMKIEQKYYDSKDSLRDVGNVTNFERGASTNSCQPNTTK